MNNLGFLEQTVNIYIKKKKKKTYCKYWVGQKFVQVLSAYRKTEWTFWPTQYE